MDIRKQIKLDLISMRPYYTLKNLIIFTAISFFYMFIMKKPSVMLSMSLIFAMLFSSFPFLLGENSGIDGLYKIFSIKSEDVVVGRYVLAGIIYIVSCLIVAIYYFIVALIRNFPLEPIIFINLAINFIVFAIITSLQYPVFFKYGYTKAKNLALMPIFLIGIIGVLIGFFIKDINKLIDFLYLHKYGFLLALLILLVIIIIFSIKLSIKFYKKRDF